MYRPWGQLDWTLGLDSAHKWSFVGCLGPEERSIVAFSTLDKLGHIQQAELLRIEEPNSPTATIAKKRIESRVSELAGAKTKPKITDLDLLESIFGVDAMVSAISSDSVILDITSMPKRYFFYLIKRFLLGSKVKNFIITYTPPDHYPDGALSGDEEPWDILPTFRPLDPDLEEEAKKRLIVNVGFMPDGLIAYLGGPIDNTKIDLIIPFPAPMAALQRTWQSVWALTSAPSSTTRVLFNETRVSSGDISSAFQRILTLLPQDSNLVSFAPFGPKPISAAMCIYATLTGCPVYYSQPKAYDPDYSIGIKTVNGAPFICTYWIKVSGGNLYSLPVNRQVFSP